MPTFRFEALDPSGKTEVGHIQAADPSAANESLRAKGLFVTTLKKSDDEPAPEPRDALSARANGEPEAPPRPGRWVAIPFTVAGLACLAIGIAGVVDALQFAAGADRATATVVGFTDGEDPLDILEFIAAGRQQRVVSRGPFGIRFSFDSSKSPKARLNHPVEVLYPPDRPEEALCAGFMPQYGPPLTVLVLGLIFTPVGLLVARRGIVLTASSN